ncbi:unnamed protein product [Orchesella dallaii]|uniref:Methyltransferase FkbM domain-containing protein n=1 Tax=Orchesella dallaii TaxID=48710 RepID=A0ABP1S6G4_9HEXA
MIERSNYLYKTCLIGIGIAGFIYIVHLLSPPPGYIGLEQQKIPLQSEPLDIAYVEENLHALDQKDPQLIQYTRVRYLSPPSKLPYNFEGAGNYKDEFSAWVADFFKNKKNGIFIEAGAHEGEKGSHTLYLEKELGWTGLLVECNPTVVPILKTHHRKAWVADVCLAPSTTPGLLNFSNPTNWTYSGTFKKPWNLPVPTKWTFFDVETLPFYTLLAALGWTEIDYFSFDIEGIELSVLKTFPFDLIKFKVLIIETMFYTEEEKKELDTLLTSNDYQFVKNMQVDKIYIHKSVSHMLGSLG